MDTLLTERLSRETVRANIYFRVHIIIGIELRDRSKDLHFRFDFPHKDRIMPFKNAYKDHTLNGSKFTNSEKYCGSKS